MFLGCKLGTHTFPSLKQTTPSSFNSKQTPDTVRQLQMSFAPYGAIYRVKGSVMAHQLRGQTAAQTTCSCKSNPDSPLCVSVWHRALKGRWYHYDHFIVLFHELLNKGDTYRGGKSDRDGIDISTFICKWKIGLHICALSAMSYRLESCKVRFHSSADSLKSYNSDLRATDCWSSCT